MVFDEADVTWGLMKTWGFNSRSRGFRLLTMPVLAQGTKDGAKEEAEVGLKAKVARNSSA